MTVITLSRKWVEYTAAAPTLLFPARDEGFEILIGGERRIVDRFDNYQVIGGAEYKLRSLRGLTQVKVTELATLLPTEGEIAAAVTLAERWAAEDEDIPVTTSPDKFSAFHSAEKAAADAAQTELDRIAAAASAESARIYAEGSGNFLWYETKADADSALASLANLQIIEVKNDETQNQMRSRYMKVSGSYVHLFNVLGTGPLARASRPNLPIGDIAIPAEYELMPGASCYWDGSQVQWRIEPYDLIDFTLDPSLTVNEYYIDRVSGSNGNAGTSSGAAWATMAYAVSNAVSPAIIYLLDDWIGTTTLLTTAIFDGKFKIVGSAPGGKPTRITNMLESYTVATFAWTDEGGGVWSTSTADTSSTIFGRLGTAMWDNKYQDEHGLAMIIPQVADQATCAATPGTQFHDTANSIKYVHLLDGREPDPADGWMYSQSQAGITWQQASDTGVLLIENLRVYRNAKGATSVAHRYRNSNSTSANNSWYGEKDVCVSGGSGDNFQIYDASRFVRQDCHSRYAHNDGFDVSSFVSTGDKGGFIRGIEHNCSSLHLGGPFFADHVTVTGSQNAFTAHSSARVLRTNCIGAHCYGATFADVNGCLSININCGGSTPGGDWPFIFWHEKYSIGTNADPVMYLIGCYGDDNGDAAVKLIGNLQQSGGAGNAGEVRVTHWRGQTDGGVTGTLYDLAGDPL